MYTKALVLLNYSKHVIKLYFRANYKNQVYSSVDKIIFSQFEGTFEKTSLISCFDCSSTYKSVIAIDIDMYLLVINNIKCQ